MGVANGAWRWDGTKPQVYTSSPGVRRYFCSVCGAPMAFSADRFPDEIHFYASLLEDAGDFEPQVHYHHDERLPWVHLSDDLPKKG
nr:GFA family protein [Algicella marina]